MFGGKKKLYAHGAQAEGVVVSHSSSNDRIHFRVVVRTKLPDGSMTEFQSEILDAHDVGSLYQGSVVPVRYDPTDHSKIAIDYPVLRARHNQANAAQQAQLNALVADLWAPSAQPDSGDLKAQLLQLAAQNPGSVIDLRSSQPPAEQGSAVVD